jgi:hypothetical protein
MLAVSVRDKSGRVLFIIYVRGPQRSSQFLCGYFLLLQFTDQEPILGVKDHDGERKLRRHFPTYEQHF